jgi:hypothetical protein
MVSDYKWSSLTTACVVLVGITATYSPAAVATPTCKDDLPKTNVYGGIVTVTAKKSWQPRGGEFTFVIETPNPIPADALISVCFGWKHADKLTDPKGFEESRPTRIVKLDPDRKVITIAASVPELTGDPPRSRADGEETEDDRRVYQGFYTVPVADVRTLIYQPNGTVVVDVLTAVGITRVGWAVFVALAAVVVALALLYLCSRIRQRQLTGANAFLRIIANERNYASLSQAQIILWTLVVGASAVYVMALSGDLIEITGGTLVLLGISGAATVATKWKSAIDERAAAAVPPAPAPPGPAAPAPVAPAPVAPAPLVPPPKVLPTWSDLVIGLERVDGNIVETIDVTRVQMLFFTLITAGFVVMKVVTGYEIPPIPDGFMTLMGISNGVYLGSKFAK